jgi:hypothetical protein
MLIFWRVPWKRVLFLLCVVWRTAILWCRRQALPWIPAAVSPSPALPPRACSRKIWCSYSRFQDAGPPSALWDWGDSTSLHLRHALHPPTMGHAPFRLTRTGPSQLDPIIKISTWDRGRVPCWLLMQTCNLWNVTTVAYFSLSFSRKS